MATMDRATVLAHFEALGADDKWWVAENIMSILKGAGPIKPRGRKPKSDDTESDSGKKRSKVNLHHVLTKFVKPALDSAAAAEDDATKKLMLKGRAQRAVAQSLVDKFKDTPAEEALESLANEDIIINAFSAWRQTPEANASRKPRSTASSGSESKPKKSKLADMTEEEKKAFYKARGEAAAAARAAKKATKSEDEAKPVQPAKEDDDASSVSSAESESESEGEMEAEEVRPYAWTHAMEGKPETKYERCDIEGKAYLYDFKTKKFLGMWIEKKNKIKKDVEDPCA
jgi:hypothetical protein